MGIKKANLAVLIVAGLVAAGCSARKPVSTSVDLEEQLRSKEREITELRTSVDRLEKDLGKERAEASARAEAVAAAERTAKEAETRAKAAEKAARSAGAGPSVSTSTMAGTELLPPSAKPGECYARVFVPPTYGTETVRVLKREESERVEVVPARYEWVEERVPVKEASERLEVVPARYETREERVLVKQASTEMVEVPAQYAWEEEKVLVKPAHTVWKKGRGPIEKIDDATGEIMCLVEVPATYKTVKKRVLKTPATTKKVEIPAEYKTVKKTVMVKPPTTRKVEIPAEYSTVKVRKMVSPPQERRITVPAEYETVTKTAQLTDGRMEWRPVLCETNMNMATIRKIQSALSLAGHDPGPIDGIYGARTRAAVRSFQQAKGLPTGGLTLTTIKKLGVTL